eukprot:5378563-Pyramimonas_sp.AAC.1
MRLQCSASRAALATTAVADWPGARFAHARAVTTTTGTQKVRARERRRQSVCPRGISPSSATTAQALAFTRNGPV